MGRIVIIEDRDGRRGVGEVSREDQAAEAFALETAQLDLKGQQRGLPAWRLLGGQDGRDRPIGELCFSAHQIRDAFAAGVRTVKIKDLALGEVDHEYALRIDFNGRRGLQDALRFRPELIEEPGELEELQTAPDGVAIAVDESLSKPGGIERALRLAVVSVFVLKPVLLGGFRRCLELARHPKELIVTHYLDGPVGHAAATQLAFALPKGRFAHGLGWHAGLDRAEVPQLVGGVVKAPDWPGVVAPHVREAVLARM